MVEGCSQSETECEQLPLRVGLSAPAWQFNFTEYSLPHEDLKVIIERGFMGAGARNYSKTFEKGERSSLDFFQFCTCALLLLICKILKKGHYLPFLQ